MKILLDINILLDVFLNRKPWVVEAAALFTLHQEGRIIGSVSAATIPTLFYIMRRNSSLIQSKDAVRECLNWFEIIPVGRQTLELAQGLTGSDFEDNLQIACAIEARLDAIVTRDAKGFLGSSIPFLTPAELIARLGRADQEATPAS